MRALDVPVDELRRKYQADPGSLTVDEYEALTRYKKLVATPAAAAKKSGPTPPKRKPGRKRRESLIQRAERLRIADLDLIESKQSRGENLTESDRKSLREIIATTAAPATVKKTHELVQGSIEKALHLARLKAFHRLVELIDSRREDVSLQASIALKAWADAEEPAAEPYTLADAQPKSAPADRIYPEQNIVNISSGVA